MKYHTTQYKLSKNGEEKFFNSEKDACVFLGVVTCSVASCYRKGSLCKGWAIEKIRSSTHGETKTRLFKIWESMHERCERKTHKHYKDYGARGIFVCEEWKEYKPFRDWAMVHGYSEDLTIDRKDTNGEYSPDNCRWITMKKQQNNKRNNHFLTWNGETKTITEWSEATGIKKTTIKERLNLGWSVDKTLTTPVRQRTKGYRPSLKMDEEVSK